MGYFKNFGHSHIFAISVLSKVGHFQILEVPPSRWGADGRKKLWEIGPLVYPHNICENGRNRRRSTREVIQLPAHKSRFSHRTSLKVGRLRDLSQCPLTTTRTTIPSVLEWNIRRTLLGRLGELVSHIRSRRFSLQSVPATRWSRTRPTIMRVRRRAVTCAMSSRPTRSRTPPLRRRRKQKWRKRRRSRPQLQSTWMCVVVCVP